MSKKGFTLLELLVTISIIGILMAIGAVSFSTAQKRGRDTRRQGDLKAIQKSLEQCYSLDSVYPGSVPDGGSLECTGGESTMNLVPSDPLPDPTTPYTYTVDAVFASYCMCAALENSGNGNAIDNGSSGGGSCNYTGAGDKDYFCVSNQQ